MRTLLNIVPLYISITLFLSFPLLLSSSPQTSIPAYALYYISVITLRKITILTIHYSPSNIHLKPIPVYPPQTNRLHPNLLSLLTLYFTVYTISIYVVVPNQLALTVISLNTFFPPIPESIYNPYLGLVDTYITLIIFPIFQDQKINKKHI